MNMLIHCGACCIQREGDRCFCVGSSHDAQWHLPVFLLPPILPGSGTHTHYSDDIMGAIASQITSLASVYSAVWLGADQIKHQSPASLAFVWGIHRRPVNYPHKGPVTRKMFPFNDVIMSHILLPAVHSQFGGATSRSFSIWRACRSASIPWNLITRLIWIRWPQHYFHVTFHFDCVSIRIRFPLYHSFFLVSQQLSRRKILMSLLHLVFLSGK